jgi:uncharacterized protein YecE (DUF72 family)
MLLVGSVVDRLPGTKYTAKLRFAELALRGPLPRVPTLRRLRAQAPDDMVLALRAPRSTLSSARGPLRFDAELERSFAWLLGARDALAAQVTVLPTPSDLTTGQRDRDLLAELASKLPRAAGSHWVWEPSGPWERDQAERVANDLGFVLAFDPLRDPLPAGDVAYAQLRAIGERRSFSEAILEQVHALLASDPRRQSFVSIDAPRSFAHAVRMQELASALEPQP